MIRRIAPSDERVVAIVITYRRPEALRETLQSLQLQTRPVTGIVVVDNAADQAISELCTKDGNVAVEVLPQDDNLGFEGGLAVGIAHVASTHDPDYYWLLDDDSPVAPDSLARGLQALVALPPNSVLANRGARLRCGRVRPIDASDSVAPLSVDMCLFDGTLYPAAAIRRTGVPRSDFFLMFGDYEYALRLRDNGFPLYVAPSVRSAAQHLGSQAGGPPWRSYYQTRNHVRTAMIHRSPALLYGALDRMTRQIVWTAFRTGDRRGLRIRLRLFGLWDALRGRMGRSIEPSRYP